MRKGRNLRRILGVGGILFVGGGKKKIFCG